MPEKTMPEKTMKEKLAAGDLVLCMNLRLARSVDIAMVAKAGGYDTPKQGEAIRDLLDEAIAARYEADKKGYRAAIAAGQQELQRRLAAPAA
jgi:hypothetical protein